MRIRTIYFKVGSMAEPREFWSAFLDVAPTKDFDDWCEFRVGEVRFAMLVLDKYEPGNSCVPVFELASAEAVKQQVDRAVSLGASVVLDGLADPEVQSVVLDDPMGNQFEITKIHD